MLAETFESTGAVVVRGVVAADEIARMAKLVASLIPDSPHYPGGIVELTGAAVAYPELMAIACDRRFGELAKAVLRAERVQHLQDSLLYKCASTDASVVAWHQDHTYLGFLVPARIVSLRIALTHETVETGCMRVVDGSHAWGPLGPVRALSESNVASIEAVLTSAQREALAGARAIELAPGDVSIHHCLALHGSGPNRGDRARTTIILRMFDGACVLDPARLPAGAETHFPVDDDGHLASSRFPIVG